MSSKVDSKPRLGGAASSARMDRRRARTRESLISAAETLFAGRAVESVSIDDIANTADVAKGTFYNHFDDKETIACEVLLGVRGDVERSIRAINLGVADAPARVARALASVMKFGLQKPQSARALLRLRTYPPARGSESAISAGVRHDIRAGMDAGQFDVSSVALGITIVYGIADAGLAQVLDHADAVSVPILAEQLGMCMLRALGVRTVLAARVAKEAAGFVL